MFFLARRPRPAGLIVAPATFVAVTASPAAPVPAIGFLPGLFIAFE